MEVPRNFLASPPTLSSTTHLKNCSFHSPSSSVVMLHEQVAPATSGISAASLARCLPVSVPVQYQLSDFIKNGVASQAIMERKLVVASSPLLLEERDSHELSTEDDNNHGAQLLHMPGLWYLFPSSEIIKSVGHSAGDISDVEVANAVHLARKALSASKLAAIVAEHSKLVATYLESSPCTSMPSSNLIDLHVEEETSVRSTRLLKRRSKRRRVQKPKVTVQESKHSEKKNLQRKISEAGDQNDQLWSFVNLETKLLTACEESDLIVKIQGCMRLEEVKSRLCSQFSREPTPVEWGTAVGLSSQQLQSQLREGHSSREKLIHANYRLVVHIAKQYQGRGVNLQDLLQEGSIGLMRSIEKFKPQAGCRFATYAFWWIRQAIRKAVFQKSRTIRLPDNVYALLSKVKEAKRAFVKQGCYHPTKEEIASAVGMTTEKLEILQCAARMPVSMQQSVWADQETTFQEVTADRAIETPELCVEKQLMRLHIRNLLGVLNPKERRIIRLRFGIEDGEQKSLSDIGAVFGLSKERVRQLESRALHKLKQRLDSQGLKAYGNLLL